MDSQRIDGIEDRLRQLERRLEFVDYRLRSLENTRDGAEPVATPPPFRPAEPRSQTGQAPAPPPVIQRPPLDLQRLAAPGPSPEAKRNDDTEYMIGAKLLPKLGAGLVLLGVLFFVAWGYSAGWITPWMVFSGEILFCLAFIAIGQWQRNEKEQYGQILTGIGSCGAYLSLAGGHLVQHLFSGEVLVASFMALSFINLGYGLWAKSRSFLAIGIIGGFAAALLPMREDKTTLNAILHLAIVVPAALIAAKRRWADMAAWLWLAASAATIPLLLSAADWRLQVAVLYLSAVFSVAAYAFSNAQNKFDAESILGSVMLFGTAFAGLALQHQRIGSIHLILLGVAAGLAALLAPADSKGRNRLLITGLAIPATIAPLCFAPVECIAIFTGLALIASALSVVGKSRLAIGFAGLELGLALMAYLAVQNMSPLSQIQEVWILCGLLVAVIVTSFATVRSGGSTEHFTIGAMALLLPLFARLGIVGVTGSTLSPSSAVSATESLAFFALAAIGLTARTKWYSAACAMWTSFGIALLAYLYAVGFGNMPTFHEEVLVAVLAVTAALGLPVATETSMKEVARPMAAAAGVLIGFFAMRFAFVVATAPSGHANAVLAVAMTAVGYSVAASALGKIRKSIPAMVVAWVMFVAAGAVYLQAVQTSLKLPVEMALISGLFAAFVAACYAVSTVVRRQPELWNAIALLGWVIFSRWIDVGLNWSGTDLHGASTMTVAWIAYALGLLTIGFWLRAQELRYWSFGVMLTTTAKILLVDLASASVPFRVGVLLCLGLLMLGGGYWYIKGKSSLQTR